MTTKELALNSYKEWKTESQWPHTYANCLWQKRISKNNETLYFININQWNFPYEIRFVVEVTLYQQGDYFTAQKTIRSETVADIEKWANDLYVKLDCIPDQDN